MTIKEQIKRLQKIHNQNQTIAVEIWYDIDIIDTARNMKVALSSSEITEALEQCQIRHDASIGINWNTIEAIIESIVRDRS